MLHFLLYKSLQIRQHILFLPTIVCYRLSNFHYFLQRPSYILTLATQEVFQLRSDIYHTIMFISFYKTFINKA